MKRFGLIGHPIGHSMSPLIHTRIMEMAGIEGTYKLFDIPPSRLRDEVPRLMRELDGFNCTIPHKEQLAQILGAPFGAVNTVFQGKGYNTDFHGFRTCGFDFKNKDVLLLGAGGTARMMMEEVLQAGAKSLTIFARKERSTGIPACVAWVTGRNACAPLTADILLNATPLGMWPRAWEMPCGLGLRPDTPETGRRPIPPAIFDAVYNPTPTRLVLNARKHGATAIGGLQMLVRQAIEAQKIWNPGILFDTASIEAAILPEVSRELLRHSPIHLLLTGFMGAGKSSVAKLLAQKLGIACVDLDAEIEAQTGRTIPDIFKRDGEAAFRGIEHTLATRALKENTSSVVAAGGGLVISKENQTMIRETNTLVLHLDAPFETLWARVAGCANRPLLEDRPRAECLYQTRQPVYHAFCDFAFNAAQPLSQLTSDITVQLTHTGNQHDSRP